MGEGLPGAIAKVPGSCASAHAARRMGVRASTAHQIASGWGIALEVESTLAVKNRRKHAVLTVKAHHV